MIKSIYDNVVFIKGDCTINLSEKEREIIVNALTLRAPKEVDIIPLMILTDKIARGEVRNV